MANEFDISAEESVDLLVIAALTGSQAKKLGYHGVKQARTCQFNQYW